MFTNNKSKLTNNSPIYQKKNIKMQFSNSNNSDENLKELKNLIIEHIAERREGDKKLDDQIYGQIKNLLQQTINKSQLLGTKTPKDIINFYIESLYLQRGTGSFIVEKCCFAILRYLLICRNEDKKLIKELKNAIEPLIYIIFESVNYDLQINA